MPLTMRGIKASPDRYENDTLKVKLLSPRATIPKTSRDISFSRYGAVHSELVYKGLHWEQLNFKI